MKKPYLDLLKRTLLNTIYAEGKETAKRIRGEGVHQGTHSMIGWKRMNNLQACCEQVIKDKVEGDFIETGVWEGGSCILMKAILNEYNDTRKVWVADSFQGIPKPRLPQDKGHDLFKKAYFVVPMVKVVDNFKRYNLLDDSVCFLEGWFKDTLPIAPIDKLSVLRLDGDLYESTMDGLNHLYPKLSPGGYCIVDDYGCYAQCKQAITDYRQKHNIEEPIIKVDFTGVFWRKTC